MQGSFITRKGKNKNTYYYRATIADLEGKRPKINLGHDLDKAKIKFNSIVSSQLEIDRSLNNIWLLYSQSTLLKKSHCTQKDYARCWLWLSKTFDQVDINDIEPHHVQTYLDLRDCYRGNRECALLSLLFNFARRRGFTKLANPCGGTIKFKEVPRSRYIEDEEYAEILNMFEPFMIDYLDLLLITGARPADIQNLLLNDIDPIKNTLTIRISKNQNRNKNKLVIFDIVGELKVILDRMKANRPAPINNVETMFLNVNDNGEQLTYNMVRYRFDEARIKSGIDFQMRDLRAKNASDSGSVEEAKARLGHSTTKMTDDYRRSRKSAVVQPLK